MRLLIILIMALLHAVAFSQSCDLESEGFENGGSDPAGWTRVNSYNGTTAPNTGTYHAGFNTDNDAYITDTYGCPDELCYFWRTSGGTSNFTIDVQWSDDGGSTWTTFESFNTQDSSSITTYRQNCLDLSGITFSDPSNVSFQFLQYNRVGGSWYLDDVCISSGGATQLIFTSIPVGCNTTNTNLATTVCAVDDCGNTDNTYAGSITVSKSSGSGTLSGTTTLSATSGCATFSDLQFDAASNYTLLASDGILTDATSSSIEIKASCPTEDTLTVVTYNLLNFPDGRDDCGTNTTITNRVDTLKKIMKYLSPDILMVCEMNNSSGADLILNSALNVDGITKYARTNFVANQSSGASGLDNMFYYNTEKVTLYSQGEVLTDLRDIGEYVVYGNDPNLGTNEDTTFIDFYEGHLKAGSAAGDETRRSIEADSMRNHIDSKPSGRNNVFGGDFNLYSDVEAAYQTLCYSGIFPFNDPISREGSWSSNPSFADVHSQSTRFSESIECGATGGCDDRFDFLLVSDSILTGGNRVEYISNTYTALGNNGSTYNDEINNVGNTSAVSDSILTALYYMSDHLPITMKLKITYPTIILPLDTTDETVNFKDSFRDNIFNIYPNPSSGTLNIDLGLDINLEKNKVVITNIMGEVVLELNQLNHKNKDIDVSNLNFGMYFVNLSNSIQVIKSKKLILK